MQPVDLNRTKNFLLAIVTELNQRIEALTLGMYWSTLEVGLAIIAACLPSLSALMTTNSIQSAIRSMRSVLSLHSSHGSKIGVPDATDGYIDLEHRSSSSSRVEFAKSGVETHRSEYEMGAFEASK